MSSLYAHSNELQSSRLRLMALLSLYDLLPPAFDGMASLPDFDSLPALDSAIDSDSVLRSLVAIARKLHSPDATVVVTFPDDVPTTPLDRRSGIMPDSTAGHERSTPISHARLSRPAPHNARHIVNNLDKA